MIFSTGNRGRQRARGFRALGLFVAVWLNLALAPCAMAYEHDADHDCPNCPPAEMHGHHDMPDGGNNVAPCADAVSDCMLEADANHDGRSGQLKLKDSVTFAVLPVASEVAHVLRALSPSPQSYSTAHPGAPPPLHKLYCVYLD